jgi:hypothetical protein
VRWQLTIMTMKLPGTPPTRKAINPLNARSGLSRELPPMSRTRQAQCHSPGLATVV